MRYTVSSRGVAIGVTDLGFRRIGGPNRSGYFHPTEDGERLMPLIASVLPAMRAYLHRNVRSADGTRLVQPRFIGSRLFADLAETLQHTSALELTLHREDGSLVPTEGIGIQDTEQLRPLADWEEPGRDATPGEAPDASDDDDAFAVDHVDGTETVPGQRDGLEIFLVEVNHDSGRVRTSRLHVAPPAFPRYQIHVVLGDDDATP
jgi:hypothetical protein